MKKHEPGVVPEFQPKKEDFYPRRRDNDPDHPMGLCVRAAAASVMDFGAPRKDGVKRSPASASFVADNPAKGTPKDGDTEAAIQPIIKRS